MDRSSVDPLLAAAVGGVVGATARWGVGETISPADAVSFPWHTFAVNVVGCLLIGVAAARLTRGTAGWAFTVTGVLGGFTTMSAFAVELNDFADAERTGLAMTYLISTLAVGIAVVVLGEMLGEAIGPRGQPEAEQP